MSRIDRARSTSTCRFALSAASCLLAILGTRGIPLAAQSADNPLVEAVRNDDEHATQELIRRRVDVNVQEEDGATALAWAAVRCNLPVARQLLAAGANPNFANEQGIGPLYIAITNGSFDMAQLLLSKGANPNAARADGETVLMTAARLNQLNTLQMLVDRGANVNAREKKFEQTALMWATGYPAEVRLLLSHGADIRATTKVWNVTATIYTPTTITLGKTGIPWNNNGTYTSKQGGQNALLFAVQKHDLESARLLLDAGVNVNQAAADGTTPLLAALYKFDTRGKDFVPGTTGPASSGSSAKFGADPAMAQFLLDHGASWNVADAAGYTPLHGAALAVAFLANTGKDRSAYGGGRVRAPKKTASDASSTAEADKSAVPRVEMNAALAVVKRLLDSGADPNRQTLYPTSGPVADVRINPAPPGSSAFHIAADSDSLDLVKMLADHGANPNLVRKDGHTPFSVAVLSRDLPIIKEMITRGADLTTRYSPTDHFPDPVRPISLTRNNQSIMHIAAGAGAAEVVEYLYSQGASLDLKNSMGETPLDLADKEERYREAAAREGAEDKPNVVIKRDTTTSDTIKKLLAKPTLAASTPTYSAPARSAQSHP